MENIEEITQDLYYSIEDVLRKYTLPDEVFETFMNVKYYLSVLVLHFRGRERVIMSDTAEEEGFPGDD